MDMPPGHIVSVEVLAKNMVLVSHLQVSLDSCIFCIKLFFLFLFFPDVFFFYVCTHGCHLDRLGGILSICETPEWKFGFLKCCKHLYP